MESPAERHPAIARAPGGTDDDGAVAETTSEHDAKQSNEAPSASDGADEEVDNENEQSSPSTTAPSRRARRPLILLESESDSDQSARGARRRGRRVKNLVTDRSAPSPGSTDKPKRRGRAGESKATAPGKKTDGDDDSGDYVHVAVGDCVLLDSGDPDNLYVALVSSVQLSQSRDRPATFTAQWYYKPEDVPPEVRATIAGGVLPDEVFLSPHKDKNTIDAVVGLCNVVTREEYDDIKADIDRGYKEKSARPMYLCRFKFYPSRSVKKALEALEGEDIRGGLGPQKPKVGEQHQAAIPELREKPAPVPVEIPLSQPVLAMTENKGKQVWSRDVVKAQELTFRQFHGLLDTLRFAIGNVVKMYRHGPSSMGHIRCLVLKFLPADSIEICTSTGEIKSVLRSDLYSPLTDDIAFTIFYAVRFNLSYATHECTKKIIDAQRLERMAFKQEVSVHARVGIYEKETEATEDSNDRKRRK